MPIKNDAEYDNPDSDMHDIDAMLYARHTEINSYKDLELQRGTNIPALFSSFYKFIQNPSSVSCESYKRMVDTDDTVGSGIDFLTTCLASRLGRYEHKNKEISDWVNARLKEIKGGWTNTVKQILSSTWAGFSVSEKVWANTEHGFVPQKIVTLPPSTILFETERTGEITKDGILQYQRNWNPLNMGLGIGYFGGAMAVGAGFQVGSAQPDPFAKFGDLPFPMRTANSYNYLSIRIPRQKCLHYAFDAQGAFGNPYGRSLLRRAYKWWVQKDAYCRMLAVALDRKGTPLTIVYASQHTTIVDGDKAGQGNQKGKRNVGISPGEAAHKAFEQVHNDTFIVLPGKKGEIFDTDFVPQNANSDAFMQAIDRCDKGILRSLLIPALIFGSGDGSGSYSLGQEHAKTFEKLLDSMNDGLQEVLIQDLVKEMIVYNFPEELWKQDGYGTFGSRDFSQEEIDKMMKMYSDGVTAGIIDVNDLDDLNKMRETMGFSRRETAVNNPNADLLDSNGELDSGTTSQISDEDGNIITADSDTNSTGPNDLADLALNGAQVSALLEVISSVVSGLLPQSSAIEIIHAAFPLIDLERIKRIISPIKVDKSLNAQPKKEAKPWPASKK